MWRQIGARVLSNWARDIAWENDRHLGRQEASRIRLPVRPISLTLRKLAVIVTTIESCRSFIYFSTHFISVRMPWWQVGPSFENEATIISRVASHKWY